jgi:hypothetical protein
MMFFARKKAPSPVGFAADLSPQGEVKGAEPHLSLRGRGRHVVAGEGALPSPDCAIWNDITRALDTKPRGAK